MRSIVIGIAVLSIAGAAQAQDDVAMRQAKETTARVALDNPVKGAPYSADIVIESSQTLADGNRISNSHTAKVFRDSEGRTRREQEAALTSVSPSQPVVSTRKMVISITDPVAGFSYSLDPEHKIAWRTPMPSIDNIKREIETATAKMKTMLDNQATPQDKEKIAEKMAAEKKAVEARAREGGAGGSGEVIVRGRGVVTLEDGGPLEHRTIDGLAVDGRKRTNVIPAGAIGNDQPLTITSEEWTSPELKVLVLTRHSDPRTGESSYRLTNIVRAEPDASLFIVPSDYEIKDTNIRRNQEELARKKIGADPR
jgi:hypothetical protein